MTDFSLVRAFRRSDGSYTPLTHGDVGNVLNAAGALTVDHPTPDAQIPHVDLSHAGHTGGAYANVGMILENYPDIVRAFGFTIRHILQERDVFFTHVFGSSRSATKLASTVVALTGTRQIHLNKVDTSEGSRQVWDRTMNNHLPSSGYTILQVEDVINSGSSAIMARSAVVEYYGAYGKHCTFAPVVPTIVSYTNEDSLIPNIGNSEVLPLFTMDIEVYPPDRCPYCAQGSPALRPREGDNWKRLTRK